jgi:hypothetical protein
MGRLRPLEWFQLRCRRLRVSTAWNWLRRLALWTAPLLLSVAALSAQTNTAEISGSVKDASGAVLPGVSVSATHGASGVKVERVTGDRGEFLLPNLALGGHTLEVELSGFKRLVREGVVLNVGQKVELGFVLEVGDLSEHITVMEAAPLLQTKSPEISEVIQNERLVNLPLNGR